MVGEGVLRSASAFLFCIIALLAVFYFTERAFSPVFQACIEKHYQANASAPAKNYVITGVAVIATNIQCSGDFIDANATSITALATIIIAAFTGTLWAATTRQAKLTKEALIADKRAFVFAKNLGGFWEIDPPTGTYGWRFRPLWENSGETPTFRMVMHTSCELRNAPLPADFRDFDQSDDKTGSALMGPKSSSYGGLAPVNPVGPISAQDLLDVQNGRKYLYLWGWARYNDVFPGTQQHLTRFAWAITILGDPFAYDPTRTDNSLSFGHIYLQTGNCADDECKLQGFG